MKGKRLVEMLAVLGTSACATGGGTDLPADPPETEDVIALVVQNEYPGRVTAFVQWRGGRPARLGDLSRGATRTFDVPLRGQEVGVVFEFAVGGVGDPGDLGFASESRTGERFAEIRAGERMEWTLTSSRDVFYRRLSGR